MAYFVLRNRKGVPGVGRMIARRLGAYEVTSGSTPSVRPGEGDVVINYGVSRSLKWKLNGALMINDPLAIQISVNKLTTLQYLDTLDILEHTTDRNAANEWLEEGNIVYARTILCGKKGNGINVIHPNTPLVPAPLYTKAFPTTHEFRVHVAGGSVIDFVQKKRMSTAKLSDRGIVRNDLVRNRGRGWVMAHNDLYKFYPGVKSRLLDQCVQATELCELHYGAVDVLYNNKMREFRICEVNSAPGMFKSVTKDAYINYFLSVH